MGIAQGLGIDIDPSARAEARENVSLNQLEDRIEISNQSLETIDGAFNLVTANLRYPTLNKICSILKTIAYPEGFVVCSGIRSHESTGLIKAYEGKDFKCLWSDQAHDWAGVVFRKNS
jgi:ribosomal protein L11 methylase PrmA